MGAGLTIRNAARSRIVFSGDDLESAPIAKSSPFKHLLSVSRGYAKLTLGREVRVLSRVNRAVSVSKKILSVITPVSAV